MLAVERVGESRPHQPGLVGGPRNVQEVPPDELHRLAIADHEGWTDRDADAATPRHFVDRIVVTHIRHRLTEEGEVLEAADRVGVAEATKGIRCKVFVAIRDAYRRYADECGRQFRTMERLDGLRW